jgi:hypothetical protein
MKGDAVIRVPRASWSVARAFANRVGRELREVTGTALREYVEVHSQPEPGETTKVVKHV